MRSLPPIAALCLTRRRSAAERQKVQDIAQLHVRKVDMESGNKLTGGREGTFDSLQIMNQMQ